MIKSLIKKSSFTLLTLAFLNFPLQGFSKNNSIDDILISFGELKEDYIQEKDHRLVFTYIYLETTKEIKKQINSGVYENPDWIENITVKFANLYVSAIKNYDQNLPLAKSWELSFNVNATKKQYLSTQLLMAMNAHINHDLPLALEKSFYDGYSPIQVRRDFFKMNELFSDLTPRFLNLMYEMEELLGVIPMNKGLKEYFIFNYIKWMRNGAWENGNDLFTSNSFDRELLENKIKKDALDHGLLIYSGRIFIPRH